MARLRRPVAAREPAKVDVSPVPPELLLLTYMSASDMRRRTRAREEWFESVGLGDRRAHAGERLHAVLLGLDSVGARFEDPRLLLRDYIPDEGDSSMELLTREPLGADGTARPYSARTPPGWRPTREPETSAGTVRDR
jgi:hypothetical protein